MSRHTYAYLSLTARKPTHPLAFRGFCAVLVGCALGCAVIWGICLLT